MDSAYTVKDFIGIGNEEIKEISGKAKNSIR